MFCIMAGPDMVNDMMKVDEAGNRVGNSYDGVHGELSALDIEVGTVYSQVIGAMALVAAALVYFEGSPTRWFWGQLPFCLVQLKHILVDGLIPPPPVMVLAAGTLAVTAYGGFVDNGKESYGKYAYVGQGVINLIAFVADPVTLVKDTWPDISGAALESGVIFVGVFQCYVAIFLVLSLIEPAAKAQFVAMVIGMGQLSKDVFINDTGPPMPILVTFVGIFFTSAYGFFAEGAKGKSKSS